MIPAFDIHGVLPPIRPGAVGHSADRAPYPTDMLTFCQRFGCTAERRRILLGLLDLRSGLRAVGAHDGYQWLDGSFAEDVERLRERPPNDIDVVTFAPLGDEDAQQALLEGDYRWLFDQGACKANYYVDHYVVVTSAPLTMEDARRIGYWHSMWSHQRDTNRWKGFSSVPILSTDDDARAWLAAEEAGAQ